MTVDEALVFAIEPIVPEVAPQVYEGSATEFCTYNHTDIANLFADGRPGVIVYLVQVHYCAPIGQDCWRKLVNLKNALFNVGCTYPTVEDASDKNGQHYVLECQYKDCDLYGEV